MHFNEQTCTSSRNSFVWVLGVPCTSFIAWLAVSKVGAAVWVLVIAQVVIFQPFVSDVVAVVDGDVAVEWRGLGLKRRGCGSCWGSISRLSRVCHRFRDAGGSFSAGDRKVVVVVDDVVIVDGSVSVADGGCAGIVNGDVAGVGGDEGLGVVSSRGVVCIKASTVVVRVLESIVSRVIGSICAPSLIPTFCGCIRGSTQLPALRFVSHASHSVVLPHSSPSLSPFSYPSRLPSSSVVLHTLSLSSFLNTSNTSFSLFSLAR